MVATILVMAMHPMAEGVAEVEPLTLDQGDEAINGAVVPVDQNLGGRAQLWGSIPAIRAVD
jgi:hypothetical protein